MLLHDFDDRPLNLVAEIMLIKWCALLRCRIRRIVIEGSSLDNSATEGEPPWEIEKNISPYRTRNYSDLRNLFIHHLTQGQCEYPNPGACVVALCRNGTVAALKAIIIIALP